MKTEFYGIILVLFLVGCVQQDVDADWSERGRIRVVVDRQISDIPSEMDYYFFPEDGGKPLLRRGRQRVFEGTLPAGTYRLVACCTDKEHISLTADSDYEAMSATARMLTVNGDAGIVLLITQPSYLYAGKIDLLAVKAGREKITVAEVCPVDLLKRIRLSIRLAVSVEHVRKLKGELTGVAPILFLASEKPSFSYTASVTFIAERSTVEDEYTAVVNLFGLSSEQGREHTVGLWLTLLIDDGSKLTTWVDLTEVTYAGFTANGLSDIMLDMSVIPGEVDGVSVVVDGWSEGRGDAV